MSADLRTVITDELSGWPIGSGYYQSTVAHDEARDMADTLVDEWRDACTITTAEQLDVLPDRSIVYERHRDVAWMKDSRTNADEPWWCTGSEVEEPSSAIVLPALLIRHPAWATT